VPIGHDPESWEVVKQSPVSGPLGESDPLCKRAPVEEYLALNGFSHEHTIHLQPRQGLLFRGDWLHRSKSKRQRNSPPEFHLTSSAERRKFHFESSLWRAHRYFASPSQMPILPAQLPNAHGGKVAIHKLDLVVFQPSVPNACEVGTGKRHCF